jgi:diguanylate cyclase (GGDEF)-like protein/PAS domain S-box-containing protein
MTHAGGFSFTSGGGRPTGQEMSDAALAETGDRGLAAALATHPDARVTGVLETGRFCALPDELGSTHERLPGETMFDLVPKSEWTRVIAGWQLTKQHGTHVGTLTVNDGSEISVLTFDVQDRYGMMAVLFVADVAVASTSLDHERAIASRFGTFHRDLLACVTAIDKGAAALLGWHLEDLEGQDARSFIHPDDLPNADDNWLRTLVSPGEPRRWRGRHRRADGSYLWIEFTNTNLLDEQGHVLSEMMDISEEMATAQALRRRDELLARLNDALPLGVLEIDPHLRVVYANDRLRTVVDREPAATLEEQFDRLRAEDRTALHDAVRRTLSGGDDVDLDVRLDLGDERICAVSLRALREEDEITGAVLTVSDITEATNMRRLLEHEAMFDRLTGCHNRAATMAALTRALDEARAGEDGTAVLFIDLDKFKPINDELGHAAGDQVLITVAERLRAIVREDDLVGRLGGDEFLVLLPRTSRSGASDIAERITAALTQPLPLAGMTVRIGASIGVAWSADDSADTIVASADDAMYDVKRSRNGNARH